jgi:hypothetical protein
VSTKRETHTRESERAIVKRNKKREERLIDVNTIPLIELSLNPCSATSSS